MGNNKKQVARNWIVAGYTIVAIGTIVDLIMLFTNRYFSPGSVRGDLQIFLTPLASLAGCWAWSFLSKIAIQSSTLILSSKEPLPA